MSEIKVINSLEELDNAIDTNPNLIVQFSMRKKREFHSSELVKSLAKIYGFDEILVSFKIKDFLREYLDESLFNEIEQARLNKGVLNLKIKSPLLKNDFQMRKSFYVNKISSELGIEITQIIIL